MAFQLQFRIPETGPFRWVATIISRKSTLPWRSTGQPPLDAASIFRQERPYDLSLVNRVTSPSSPTEAPVSSMGSAARSWDLRRQGALLCPSAANRASDHALRDEPRRLRANVWTNRWRQGPNRRYRSVHRS